MPDKTLKLSEFCRTGSGGTPAREVSAYFEGGSVPWVKSGELKGRYIAKAEEYITLRALNESSAKHVPKGALLVAMYGATVGDVSELAIDAATNQAVCHIVPDPSVCDRGYLFHFLVAKKGELLRKRVGGGQPNISQGIIRALEILLPTLLEQHRIAAILDKADALRAKRREAIAKLDQLLQSVFIDMFGDPIANPMQWPVIKSGDLYIDKPKIGTIHPAKGSGVLVVRVGEIGSYKIALDRCSRAELDKADMDRFALMPGDTVIARAIGSENQLGKCSYFDGHSEPVCIDSHVMRLRPDSEQCEPAWFHFLISSASGKRMLQSKGGATAVQFNINASQASDLDIPLPPLPLQRSFLDFCSRVRGQAERNQTFTKMGVALFDTLQQRAFQGTL